MIKQIEYFGREGKNLLEYVEYEDSKNENTDRSENTI